MNLNFNDVLSFLQGLNSLPMTATANAGYGLATTGQNNAYSLENQQQQNQLDEFNRQLALQQANQQYNQLLGNKTFDAGQKQQAFQNQLATQSANLYKDPAYLNYLRLTDPSAQAAQQQQFARADQIRNQFAQDNAAKFMNEYNNDGIISANNLGNLYSTLMSANIPSYGARVASQRNF